jgi:serine/threonine protein kinase/sugar lactone lactonase YvrE
VAIECPKCHFNNPGDTHFCGNCGAQLSTSDEISDYQTETLQTPIKDLTEKSAFAERYRIIQELGKGGMGVVYKAEDIKLKRTIALKTILPQFLTQEEVKKRFVREAQAAAALSHPNICTVYEIDESEGTSFIAMEYIEGESLKDKVKKKPLKIDEFLDISIQIAEGLHHAHQKDIIHRDIKSANIMVEKNGQAKIMDFGLAKLAGSTLVTRDGTTLGTIAYMSPEQAQGKPVDYRTDIWSLGIILYEIISGQLPFRGDRDQAVVYSLLNENPEPLTALRSGVPLELERIVNKCLEKNTGFRYQSTSDLIADLKRLKRDKEKEKTSALAAAPLAPSRHRAFSRSITWAALSVFAFIVLVVMYYFVLKPGSVPTHPLSELRLIPVTAGGGSAFYPTWSPDGVWISYASDEAGNLDIWKRPTEGGEAVQLTTSPDDESQPAWSPDGRMIAFFSDQEGGGIFLIPAEGGTALRLTSFGAHPVWSPDNETLAFDWCGNIYLVPYTGGEPRLVVGGTSATPFMDWTPDGKKLVYWNRTKGDIHIISIDDKRSEPLKLVPPGQEVSGLSLSNAGRELVFSRGPFGGNKNLWMIDFDPKAGKTIGNLFPLSVTTTEDIQCVFSPDGSRISFTASQLERHLWAFPIDSSTGLIKGKPEQITFKSKLNYYPALSPDGKRMVWTSHLTNAGVLSSCYLGGPEERKVTREWGQKTREVGGSYSPDGKQICYSSTVGGSYQIWRLPSLGSVALRLTKTENLIRDTMTAWSPDGETITFYSNRTGNWDIWSVQTDGRSQPKQLTQSESNENYPAWSPDGRYIAFRTDREGNGDIWIMDANGGNSKPYVTHTAEEGWSAWSPDGRWFYFISNRGSGVFNVWVKPTGGGEARQVTTYKGLSPGLPDFILFTKFAVSSSHLVVPIETRRGNIYILENLK